jgi:chromosome segregation ATPase
VCGQTSDLPHTFAWDHDDGSTESLTTSEDEEIVTNWRSREGQETVTDWRSNEREETVTDWRSSEGEETVTHWRSTIQTTERDATTQASTQVIVETAEEEEHTNEIVALLKVIMKNTKIMRQQLKQHIEQQQSELARIKDEQQSHREVVELLRDELEQVRNELNESNRQIVSQQQVVLAIKADVAAIRNVTVKTLRAIERQNARVDLVRYRLHQHLDGSDGIHPEVNETAYDENIGIDPVDDESNETLDGDTALGDSYSVPLTSTTEVPEKDIETTVAPTESIIAQETLEANKTRQIVAGG